MLFWQNAHSQGCHYSSDYFMLKSIIMKVRYGEQEKKFPLLVYQRVFLSMFNSVIVNKQGGDTYVRKRGAG